MFVYYSEDSDKVLGNPVFGLNESVLLEDFGFYGDYFNLQINVQGRIMFRRFFRVNPEFLYGKSEADAWKKVLSTILHVVRGLGVSDDLLKKALGKGKPDFDSWAKAVMSCVEYYEKTVRRIKDQYYDIFLEWQPFIKDNYDTTFLQIPKTSGFGAFFIQHVEPEGEWKEVRNHKGLLYIDEGGKVHPFMRGAWYMSSNFAKKQTRSVSVLSSDLSNISVEEEEDELEIGDISEEDNDDLPFD